LVIIIPKEAFYNLKTKLLFTSSILIVTLLTLLFWAHISSEVYTPYDAYNNQFRDGLDLVNGSNMHLQIKYLIKNPFSIFQIFLKSVYFNAQSFSQSYIGRLGWHTIPIWVIILSYISIFIAIIDSRNIYILSTKQILFIFLCIKATLFLIIFSQYLTWEIHHS